MFKIEYNLNTLGLAEIGTKNLLWPGKREFIVYIKVKRLEYKGELGSAAVKTLSIKGCKQATLRCRDSLNINCSAVEADVQNKGQKSSQALCLCWKAVIGPLI